MHSSRVFLQSKLTSYRVGLNRAKAKGDLEEAKVWLQNIVSVKKEISEMDRKSS